MPIIHHLHTVDDFLRDDDFIRFTLDADGDCPDRWSHYLQAPEAIRRAFLRATDILLHLDDCALLSPEELHSLKQRITRTLAGSLA